MTFVHVLLMVANACLLVTGQFLWKWGLQHRQVDWTQLRSVAGLVLSPPIVGGVLLYGAATVLWLFVLSRVPLSIAYPLQSIAYVLGVIGAAWWFQEPLTPAKIAGCLLIMAGVTLIGISART